MSKVVKTSGQASKFLSLAQIVEIDKKEQRKAEHEHRAAQRHVSRVHPGWSAAVKSAQFHDWISDQGFSVQRLTESPHPDAAIRLLDLYVEFRNKQLS